MSDEQRAEEEAEVEAHISKYAANSAPGDEAERDDDFQAHVRYDNIRME